MKRIIFIGIFIAIVWILAANKEKEGTVVIGFAGDTMLGRGVNEIIASTSYVYPWGNMLPLLKKNDLNIVNLETTLTKSEAAVPKVFNFKAYPDRVQCLIDANIHIVNLANNHILDFAIEGLKETIEVLDKANIYHVGAGLNEQKAEKPVIITKHGITLGILGFTDNEPTWVAGKKKPGTNYVQVGDIEEVRQQVELLKPQVDLVIVSIHWGPNMRERPSAEFVQFAHKMIDVGVDIIHGHSAHIFQGIEMYKGKLIMYDTGDFVDDYVVDSTLRNDLSFLFLIDVDKDGVKKIKLIPILIGNRQVNLAPEKDARWALKRMQKLSVEFGTTIDNNGVWERF